MPIVLNKVQLLVFHHSYKKIEGEYNGTKLLTKSLTFRKGTNQDTAMKKHDESKSLKGLILIILSFHRKLLIVILEINIWLRPTYCTLSHPITSSIFCISPNLSANPRLLFQIIINVIEASNFKKFIEQNINHESFKKFMIIIISWLEFKQLIFNF